MPELPEVDTIRSSLQEIRGSKIIQIDIFRDDIVRLREFNPEELLGKVITGVDRRGKYLLIKFENQYSLVIHLGMSGRFYLEPDGNPVAAPHIHAVIRLDTGLRLVYQDARRFGGIRLLKDTGSFFSCLGIEPLSKEFTVEYLKKGLDKRKVSIKNLLLNQKLVCGLGNIYADEALFAAGIKPERAAGSLSSQEIKALHRGIRKVLRESIKQRGTTFRDYRDGFGKPGNFQNHLQVYGKEDQPCPKCQTPLKKIVLGGRSSHFCERCQH
ncbi:MAG: bifunctional DNA-formamidopyrimidine glycosylase/DNA-(apurinic or apyrimidinic site) lyase [Syntrophomonas sp.]